MTDQKLCSTCGVANPAGNRYCGQCGHGLRLEPVKSNHSLVIDQTGQLVPGIDTRQMARTLAVSVAALTAEAALLYLRRRIRQDSKRSITAQKAAEPVNRAQRLRNAGVGLLTGAVLVIAERQLIESENGRPVRQLIERTFYRRDE